VPPLFPNQNTTWVNTHCQYACSLFGLGEKTAALEPLLQWGWLGCELPITAPWAVIILLFFSFFSVNEPLEYEEAQPEA
jgi:hypothetical protein